MGFFKIAVLALVGLVTVAVPAWSSDVVLTDVERAYIDANPTIRVSNETAWPPFNFNEAGEAKGYSIEYIQLVADKLGLKVEFVTGPSWREFLSMMKSSYSTISVR